MDWNAFWTSVGDFLENTFLGMLIQIALIIVFAVVVTWVMHFVIRRVVNQIVTGVKKTQNADDTQALAASPLAAVRVVQRTRTLGSVLTNIVNVTVVVITVITVVNTIDSSLIGSLALLSAAIGAGLGFGAQNIVKDVLNGLFMVIEDQLGVGDVVDVGPATGVVEKVGVRITQIRDVNGTLWFVRNGEILRVGNMSQGWARVIVDLAIPYDTDIDEMQDKLLETATTLAKEPKWRPRVLERPELWGLESISEDALVIRLVMKTRTSAKDDVARELRLRLKKTVDGMGVKLPALNTLVLTGFDGAASVGGAKPPRTKPVEARSSVSRSLPSTRRTPRDEPAVEQLLRRGRRSTRLSEARARVLPRRGRRPRAEAHVPRRRSGPGRRTSASLPRAVLGRPRHLQRTARPPPPAHAPHAVQGQSGCARPLAPAHASSPRHSRAVAHARDRPLGLPGARRPRHGQHVRRVAA
jgi:small-conductance mechanosensitive channel